MGQITQSIRRCQLHRAHHSERPQKGESGLGTDQLSSSAANAVPVISSQIWLLSLIS